MLLSMCWAPVQGAGGRGVLPRDKRRPPRCSQAWVGLVLGCCLCSKFQLGAKG